MSDNLDIRVDAEEVLKALRGLSQEAMLRAWRRTLRKTATWLKSRMAKTVNRETHFAQKVIKARLKYFQQTLDQGKLWAGLNPLNAAWLGKARQGKSGVTVGGYQFPGAWIMKHHPNRGVFMRAGGARFPIVKKTIEWDAAAGKALAAELPGVEAHLLATLEHEISYELSL